MHRIDLNCDLGEGMGNDALIMPYISSANIACGYHAGDADTMKRTVELALRHGVAIGAHPSFNDRAHFGRLEMELEETALYDLLLDQLRMLEKITREQGAALHHVKPHGALYNMAARNEEMANVIAKAVSDFDRKLVLYGLSGSALLRAGEKYGLSTASEVFADRSYQDDGSLTPRSMAGAMLEKESDAVQQVLDMVLRGNTHTLSGELIPINAGTICIHGDGAHAVEFAKAIHESLKQHGIEIRPI